MNNIKLDSPEGITYIIDWAIAHNYVLNQYHKDLADKYNIPLKDVIISKPLETNLI